MDMNDDLQVRIRFRNRTFRRRMTSLCTALVLAGCGVTSPIERADTTKSNFDGAVYKGTKTVIKPATPSAEAYRVFIQGATGFVSMSAVRDDAEQRAAAFCRAKGDRRWEAIEETTANPPYILGNFPRIEIVFQCLTPAQIVDSVSVSVADIKYIKLVDLKRLLDTGVITQAEFDSQKAKILAEP
jgi:Short C-terminal domain